MIAGAEITAHEAIEAVLLVTAASLLATLQGVLMLWTGILVSAF